ncbi:hypothetical protein T069G_04503 [Trichoderma breve]|uniref:CBM-cenC domain-containing protein n=1 Tax=Trichoderma breve TaxID=2034170 RepID=A0A9W9BFP4_9HYPO|nr:hypothetical protein T069G_04503 [Trichoderma breve]KAJ4859515.1 hypothetical protein T069G_04503 [Trichoderma breve]
MINKIIIGALGLAASVAATPLELVERSSCRDDSLYKCFADREYSHSASAYCSALTPVTKTVTVVKPTVTKTAWVTSTANPSTDFVSSTTTIYTATVPSLLETITKTETEMATSTATQSVTTTVTVTGSQNQQPPPTTTLAPLKRGAQGGKPEPPKCMVTKCFVYSPERITAGCSCIGVPPKTVTISQTAPCSTVTVTSTSVTTPHVTATAWQTVATELTDGVSTTTATTTATVSTTVTTTATTTATVTVSPPAQNLVPNGDFSSGLTGWTVINSSPSAWVNAGVGTSGSPDGISNAYHITNIGPTGQYFMASPSFGLNPSSSYSESFMVASTSTDSSLVGSVHVQLNCGSITVVDTYLSQATQDASGYYIISTNFNTAATTDPSTVDQLGRCQLQFVIPHSSQPPVTWFLAKVSVASTGASSP